MSTEKGLKAGSIDEAISFMKEAKEKQPTPEDVTEADIQNRELDTKHAQTEKKLFHQILVTTVKFASFCLLALVLVRVVHLIIPENIRWLDKEDIGNLDKFLFSSSLGTLIGKFSDLSFSGKKGVKVNP